ncbi:alpha/beta fold hydrolase [Streptomyces nitrosporeus]|uniref:Alpha/beta fold hydrolase n=1 Tax=Streptomyces nitrosporeus TaxID=28894 RepID=A0A5J6FCQ3_9ACTN|nr:alpha/beta fold hydrolase [Streptomyces nitrosporeus]
MSTAPNAATDPTAEPPTTRFFRCTAPSATARSSYCCLLRRSLARHGWHHLESLNCPSPACGTRATAELPGRPVDEIHASTGYRAIGIVGHSLGGPIARYYVRRPGGDRRARALVTPGTPHSTRRYGGRPADRGAPHRPAEAQRIRPHRGTTPSRPGLPNPAHQLLERTGPDDAADRDRPRRSPGPRHTRCPRHRDRDRPSGASGPFGGRRRGAQEPRIRRRPDVRRLHHRPPSGHPPSRTSRPRTSRPRAPRPRPPSPQAPPPRISPSPEFRAHEMPPPGRTPALPPTSK